MRKTPSTRFGGAGGARLPISRRVFLGCSATACAAGATIGSGTLAPGVVPYYKAIFDERFEATRQFAAAASARSIPTAAIRGDVTSLFFNDLDLRWRQGPISLIGLTTPESLFCLDLLARDRRMRLTTCVADPGVEAVLSLLDEAPRHRILEAHAPSIEPSGLVFWIIEPAVRDGAAGVVNG